MRFEDEHGIGTDGVAGPQVWRALMHDDLAGRHSDAGYNYVFVHETLPQSLSLWHDGRVILTSPGNTGIASAPTAQGTWPVFEHIPSGTMSGTNPDGTHYHDPGIRWISYFHGGDALHEFPRASFGTPQSLGCVELAGGRGGRGLALHADRDARDDRVLTETDPIAQLRGVVAASEPAPAEMAAYLEKVRDRAYAVTDRDVEALKEAGLSEDEIFEQTVAVAIAEGLRRLDRAAEVIG